MDGANAMKTQKSWRKRVNGLLFAVMIIVLLFLMWSNVFYNSQTRESIKNENATTVKVWESYVQKRLDSMYEHVFELLLTVYNNAELASGTPQMEYMTRKKSLDQMTNKLHINSDADCFFLIDTESDMSLFSANPAISVSSTAALKKSFRDVGMNRTTKLYNRLWDIESVEGEAYFVKSIALGKYVAGAMSKVQRYDLAENFRVQGKDSSCLLVSWDERKVLYHGETPDWEEWLSFDDRGRATSRSHTTYIMELSFTNNNISIVLATQQNSLLSNGVNTTTAVIILIVSLTCAALLIILAYNLNHMVVAPTRELLVANHEIISGNMNYQITTEAGSEEFGVLYESFNKMASQIVNLRIESYDRLLREQENRLLLLRAQIKPHFFLNAITTVSNMTYQNRLEDIRSYLKYLSKFVRYMLNSQRNWVSLKEEISHIENYIEMQTLRFPGSIISHIYCDDDVSETQIPVLILFTLVENTFKHAMSLYEPLELTISCHRFETEGFVGCRLTVDDNGEGFSEEFLKDVYKKAEEPTPKDHFGLSNVRYTLQLTYARNDLLHLSNNPDGGAHAEVWIPDWEVDKQ